jgi:hypothetical protein
MWAGVGIFVMFPRYVYLWCISVSKLDHVLEYKGGPSGSYNG